MAKAELNMKRRMQKDRESRKDNFFMAGQIIIGRHHDKKPFMVMDEEGNYQISFMKLSDIDNNRKLLNGEIKDTEKVNHLYSFWEKDVEAIIAGPVAARIYLENQGESMLDREDVLEMLIHNLMVSNVFMNTDTNSPIQDIEEIKKILQPAILEIPDSFTSVAFPDHQKWVPAIMDLLEEMFPPPHDIWTCSSQIESTCELVKENWFEIESMADSLEYRPEFGIPVGSAKVVSKEGDRYTIVEDSNGDRFIRFKPPKDLLFHDIEAEDGMKVAVARFGDCLV